MLYTSDSVICIYTYMFYRLFPLTLILTLSQLNTNTFNQGFISFKLIVTSFQNLMMK